MENPRPLTTFFLTLHEEVRPQRSRPEIGRFNALFDTSGLGATQNQVDAAATPISVWTGLIEGKQTIHLGDLHLDRCSGSDPGSAQGMCFCKRPEAVFLCIWEA